MSPSAGRQSRAEGRPADKPRPIVAALFEWRTRAGLLADACLTAPLAPAPGERARYLPSTRSARRARPPGVRKVPLPGAKGRSGPARRTPARCVPASTCPSRQRSQGRSSGPWKRTGFIARAPGVRDRGRRQRAHPTRPRRKPSRPAGRAVIRAFTANLSAARAFGARRFPHPADDRRNADAPRRSSKDDRSGRAIGYDPRLSLAGCSDVCSQTP